MAVLDTLGGAGNHGITVSTGGAIGKEAQRRFGCSLSEEVIDFCSEVFDDGGAVLCGPGGGRFVYELRRHFELYCKLTPLRPFRELADAGPLRAEHLQGIDIVVVRENTGGLYFGASGTRVNEQGEAVAFQHCEYRHSEVARILDIGFSIAETRRRRIAVVTKPGGIPAISALWAQCLQESNACDALDVRILEVDNAAYQLIAHPSDFDVIVCPNMFGDMIGDCGSLLLGSRGLSYSGNFAAGGRAVYQTAHGAAWDLAGSDCANPIGQVLSLAMLLRESFGLAEDAELIERAIAATLSKGIRTADIAGPGCHVVGTREMGRHICDALRHLQQSASR